MYELLSGINFVGWWNGGYWKNLGIWRRPFLVLRKRAVVYLKGFAERDEGFVGESRVCKWIIFEDFTVYICSWIHWSYGAHGFSNFTAYWYISFPCPILPLWIDIFIFHWFYLSLMRLICELFLNLVFLVKNKMGLLNVV